MKTKISIILTAFIAVCANAATVSINTDGNLGSNVNINVANSGNGTINVQTRNTAAALADYRAIAQSFQWNSSLRLDGIGIWIDPEQSSWAWGSGDVVNYKLHINTGVGANLQTPRTDVATYNIQILGTQISNTGNKYLYISGLDLELNEGQWYGFQLGPDPAGTHTSRRLFFTASDTVFEGNTIAISSPVPFDGQYTNNFGAVKDFTFYTTVIPEPSTYGFILGFGALALVGFRRFRK